jgi:hypothetical protein
MSRRVKRSKIEAAAIAWFDELRPVGMTRREHLEDPVVNSHRSTQIRLAKAVALMLSQEAQQARAKRRARQAGSRR